MQPIPTQGGILQPLPDPVTTSGPLGMRLEVGGAPIGKTLKYSTALATDYSSANGQMSLKSQYRHWGPGVAANDDVRIFSIVSKISCVNFSFSFCVGSKLSA